MQKLSLEATARQRLVRAENASPGEATLLLTVAKPR